jgi:peptidoglycan hydrolase CwlO-like protein
MSIRRDNAIETPRNNGEYIDVKTLNGRRQVNVDSLAYEVSTTNKRLKDTTHDFQKCQEELDEFKQMSKDLEVENERLRDILDGTQPHSHFIASVRG